MDLGLKPGEASATAKPVLASTESSLLGSLGLQVFGMKIQKSFFKYFCL